MKTGVRAYQSTQQQGLRDQLILDHLVNVRHILARMMISLPEFVDRENLEAAGVLGLVEAAQSFNPTLGTDFGAYAYHRIRGAILDELRSNCPLPQHILERWSKIRRFIETRQATAQPMPSPEEIARACDLSVDEVEQCLEGIKLTRPEEWQNEFGIAAPGDLSDELEAMDRVERLAKAIEQLESRLRAIVIMYYRDELRLKEIGEVLKLSESRVSRLLTKAQMQLRFMLDDDSL